MNKKVIAADQSEYYDNGVQLNLNEISKQKSKNLTSGVERRIGSTNKSRRRSNDISVASHHSESNAVLEKQSNMNQEAVRKILFIVYRQQCYQALTSTILKSKDQIQMMVFTGKIQVWVTKICQS